MFDRGSPSLVIISAALGIGAVTNQTNEDEDIGAATGTSAWATSNTAGSRSHC